VKVSFSRSALNDLQDIKAHYSDLGVPEIGVRFVRDILRLTEQLLSHPDSGRKVPEFNQEHIREMIHPPFRLVYLRAADSISVIRVWRSERLLVLPND
jgi:toxin ParE1/3/4